MNKLRRIQKVHRIIIPLVAVCLWLLTYFNGYILTFPLSSIGSTGSLLMIVLFLIFEAFYLGKDRKFKLLIFYIIIILTALILIAIIIKDSILI